jgi:hypothetical protein
MWHFYWSDGFLVVFLAGTKTRDLVTVVGTFPDANKGQQLRCAGHWEVHKTHGLRLKATTFEEVVPDSPDAIAAYLSSVIEGLIPAHCHCTQAVVRVPCLSIKFTRGSLAGLVFLVTKLERGYCILSQAVCLLFRKVWGPLWQRAWSRSTGTAF